MAKYGTYAVVALLAFGAAAGGSWIMRPAADTDDTAQTEVPPVTATVSSDAPSREADAASTAESTAISDLLPDELPVAVRPRPISADEVFRLGTLMREREVALNNRESILRQDETRVRLIIDDVRAEQKAMDGLRTEVRGVMQSAENVLQRVQQQRDDFASDQEAAKSQLESMKDSTVEFEELEQDNIKKMSAWYQNMEPDKAAEYLRTLADNGKIDMAVQLLTHFEERDASEVLAAMDDPTLVTELMDKFRMVKPQVKKTRGRK